MKKYLKLLVLMLTCSIIYLIYCKQDEKLVYTSIGDGFARGISPYGETNYGYSNYISDYLTKEEKLRKSYLDFSSKDMKINDLENMILINSYDNNQNNIKQVLRETDLLTISVGINDLIYQTSLDYPKTDSKKRQILTEIVDNFDKLILEIKKYYKNKIYIVGYYNFYPQNSVEKELLEELNTKYKQYCKQNNLVFIENNSIETKLDKYLDNPDSFYPNTAGYKEISSNIILKMPV